MRSSLLLLLQRQQCCSLGRLRCLQHLQLLLRQYRNLLLVAVLQGQLHLGLHQRC